MSVEHKEAWRLTHAQVDENMMKKKDEERARAKLGLAQLTAPQCEKLDLDGSLFGEPNDYGESTQSERAPILVNQRPTLRNPLRHACEKPPPTRSACQYIHVHFCADLLHSTDQGCY
jgi:hypothetical protein